MINSQKYDILCDNYEIIMALLCHYYDKKMKLKIQKYDRLSDTFIKLSRFNPRTILIDRSII